LKTIILAGGLGTRFSEETEHKPKPMILIDHQPIIWHIMDVYASQGHSEFVIATGFKSEVIDKWVSEIESPWTIHTIFTGNDTQTGGRIRRCIELFDDKLFFVTYGDGLGNVNLNRLLKFHETNEALVTATAVRPPARFGYLQAENGLVKKFGEKNQLNEGWINGGFFVVDRLVLNSIHDDSEPFETGALPRLTADQKFYAYEHDGFWFPMDTRSEQLELSRLSRLETPPWRVGLS
jgi:glucose-1-phosphate cytidylyltransferase